MKWRMLLVVSMTVVLAVVWVGCSEDNGLNPAGVSKEVVDASDGAAFAIGPIEGLTTAWHKAPAYIAVPLGTTVRFRCSVSTSGTVQWSGADQVEQNNNTSVASCTFATLGFVKISANVLTAEGEVADHTCRVKVIDVSIADVKIRNIEVSVSHFSMGGGHGKDDPPPLERTTTNELTMKYYFDDESIASLQEVETNQYRTSVSRTLLLDVDVDPPEMAPLVEWRVQGRATALGSSSEQMLTGVGRHTLAAGPPANPQRIQVETYGVTIISHTSGVDLVGDNEPVMFTAVTDPPGYEEHVTWLSSTKYGTADPVTWRGKTFTVNFSDTWGLPPDRPEVMFQWLGVKADNTVFNQDNKGNFIPYCFNDPGINEVNYDPTFHIPANFDLVVRSSDLHPLAPGGVDNVGELIEEICNKAQELGRQINVWYDSHGNSGVVTVGGSGNATRDSTATRLEFSNAEWFGDQIKGKVMTIRLFGCLVAGGDFGPSFLSAMSSNELTVQAHTKRVCGNLVGGRRVDRGDELVEVP